MRSNPASLWYIVIFLLRRLRLFMRTVTNLTRDLCCRTPPLTFYKCCVAIGLSFCWSVAAAEQVDKRVVKLPEPTPEPVYAQVEYAKTVLVDGVYLLNSQAQLELPALPELALRSGLPLVFMHKIEIERKRGWWFDEVVAQITARLRLEYFELTRRYQVTHLSSGQHSYHTLLTTALRKIASIRDFPLIESRYIEDGENYIGTLILSLDAEALPLPLRPQAYLSTEWNFKSEGFTWDIQ